MIPKGKSHSFDPIGLNFGITLKLFQDTKTLQMPSTQAKAH